jgi:hypothetical protein
MSPVVETTTRRHASTAGQKMVWINVAAIVIMTTHDLEHVRQAVVAHYSIPFHVAAILLAAFIPLFLSIWWATHGRLAWATTATALVTGGVLVLLSVVHFIGVEQIWGPLGVVFGMWGMSYFQMNADALTWASFGFLAVGYLTLLFLTLRVRRTLIRQASSTASEHISRHRGR